VPPTVVTNDWDAVRAFVREHGDLALKMIDGTLKSTVAARTMFTSRAGLDDIERYSSLATPFPALFQPFLEKALEWRITMVEDAAFGAKIVTAREARVDWRQFQKSPLVDFVPSPVPREVSEACSRILAHYGLKFGVFDIIELPSGEFVFLELNPNGQYQWLESQCGLAISDAIAASLARIADARRPPT
jgi:glutathione synthase/RimK-type ligase-like ATP-grasp enzyme